MLLAKKTERPTSGHTSFYSIPLKSGVGMGHKLLWGCGTCRTCRTFTAHAPLMAWAWGDGVKCQVPSAAKCQGLQALHSPGEGPRLAQGQSMGYWQVEVVLQLFPSSPAPCVDMKRDGLTMWYVCVVECVVECVVDLPPCTHVEWRSCLVLSKV
jgi:hypothetical protein